MKSTLLFLAMLMAGAAHTADQNSTPTLTIGKVAINLPDGCMPLDSTATQIKCVVRKPHQESGSGTNFGPWQVIVSYAPDGYMLVWSEGRVIGEHQCGVKDSGSSNPSPVAKDGPPETIGHLTGESHWAQCYILERDLEHVVVRYTIQGKGEGMHVVLGHGALLATTGPSSSTVFSDIELTAVYKKSGTI